MSEVNLDLWPKQDGFVHDPSDNVIFRGGFGSGKTFALAADAVMWTLNNPPGVPSLFVEPTYKHCLQVGMRAVTDLLDAVGVRYSKSSSPVNMNVTLTRTGHQIMFASGDHPASMIGFNVGYVAHDEPGVQDEEVHIKLLARLRHPKARRLRHAKGGTPEGLGWFHRLETIKDVRGSPLWSVTTATPWDNGDIAQSVLDNLVAEYQDPQLFRQYLLGQAVSRSGSVYGGVMHADNVCRVEPRNGTPVTAWDFNVHHLVTMLGSRQRNGRIAWWGEVVSASEAGTQTDEHAQRVVRALVDAKVARVHNRSVIDVETLEPIEAVTDAAGAAEKSSAHKTDEAHVRDAGFHVRHPRANPAVYDRVQNVRSWIKRRRVVWDPVGCPRALRAIRDHAYEKKSDPPRPQKKWGPKDQRHDDFNDAMGYFLCAEDMLGSRGSVSVVGVA